ncbi:MAG: single-stranded DNA-binding protein [Imperialibacter sp.]|uniref:single-stranded DNA-binding protein n=1 Tax=Imperialibacter sp. TaxID=2038411 RepID=UPI0032EF6500
MSGVNKVILLGNLGKDPEIRHLESGRAVTNFTLATSEVYKNKEGNKVTNTEWHNVVLWTPLAEVAEKYLKKGNQVYIEGKITTRSYDDKDGNKRYITEVVGREMTLVGGRPDGGGGSSEQQNSGSAQPAPVAAEPTDLDDLPF